MPAYKQDLDAVKIYPGLTADQNGLSNGNHVTKGANLNGESESRPPFKVCQDGVLGRHLVATRDVLPGEVILQEAPLVTGPPLDYRPCCVSCYKTVMRDNHMTCSKGCGWPVCSDKCAEFPTHQPECDITRYTRQEKVSIEDWDQPSPLFECLMILRCLTYRESNPSLWSKLCRLEAHMVKRQGMPKWERERDVIVPLLREYFKMDCTDEEVLRICGFIQVNGYGVRLTDPSYIALYDQLSFIEHHCIPNCSKAWSTSGALTVHSASFVPSGQHLSICYTNPLWGTASRRNHLVQELLLCSCNRCADPTECGTYYNALRCNQHSCTGYLVPEDPLSDVSRVVLSQHAGNSKWHCTQCATIQSPLQVDTVLEQFKKTLGALDKTDIGACEHLLQNGLKLFHENHFFMTELRIILAELIGKGTVSMKGVSDQHLELKINLCKQILSLANTLFPAVRRVTGLIRFELYRAMSEASVRKHIQSNDHVFSVTGKKDEPFNDAQQAFKEAVSILSCDPDIVPELFYEVRGSQAESA